MIFQEYNRNIIWSEDNYVVNTDPDSSTPFSLVMEQSDLTSANTIDFYDGMEITEEAANTYRINVSEQSLIDTCNMIALLSYDFEDDIKGWGKYILGENATSADIMKNVDVLNRVMELCGSGYTKLFVLFHKVLQKLDIMFLNNPGVSLHPDLVSALLAHIQYYSESTKFVVTDARGFIQLRDY